jgi:hypothetical protein
LQFYAAPGSYAWPHVQYQKFSNIANRSADSTRIFGYFGREV